MADVLEPDDLAGELVPDEVPETDPDLALDEPPDAVAGDFAVAPPRPFGKSWAFDFAGAARFVPVLGRGPLQTNGTDTVRFWIEKCLRTPRGSHPVHGPEYGVDGLEGLIGSPGGDPDVALRVSEAVADALTFHPKVAEVRDFDLLFDPDEEVLELSFTVVLDDDDEIAVSEFPIATGA